MYRVINTINEALGERSLSDEVLNNVFEKFWPELEAFVHEQLTNTQQAQGEQVRSERSLLEEILTLTREAAQTPGLSSNTLTIDVIRDLVTKYNDLVNLTQQQLITKLQLARQLASLIGPVESIVHGVDPFPLTPQQLDAFTERVAFLQEMLSPKPSGATPSGTVSKSRTPIRRPPIIEDDEDLPF